MKKLLFLFLSTFLMISCGTSKSSVITTKAEAAKRSNTELKQPKRSSETTPLTKVIKRAKSFKGTPYKYGGTTSKGIDCSGLIYTCYLEENIKLPRTSSALSQYGKKIKKREIDVGDLLFFETDKTRRKINHVGLVVERKQDKIYFIHSTTSRGVIISSLDESYWNSCFVMVRRVI